MTIEFSDTGSIVLPAALRERLALKAGDDFEVQIEDEDTITLRRVSRPPNKGLVDHLLACPFPFEIPPRQKDYSTPPQL